jgi:hypothetical protein
MKVLNVLKILLVISIFVFISGCGLNQLKPREYEPIKFEQTKIPDNKILEKIKKMEAKIGKSPTPVKVKVDGKIYIAFTKKQLDKLTAKDVLYNYLKDIVKLQHEKSKLMKMELNQLKRLAELQRKETVMLDEMYVKARNDANNEEMKRNIEGWSYKLVIIGQIIIMILLL